jgi:hypothetical protein
MMTRRNVLVSAGVALFAVGTMGAVALAGIPGLGKGGRKKPDTGPFGWPHLQVVKEKLDLTHDEAEALLRMFNRYEHEEKQAAQSAKTGDKNPAGPDVSSLRSDALAEIKRTLGDEKFRRFEALIATGKKK